MKETISPIQIEDVQPIVDGGKYPAKGVLGDTCVVEADIFFNRQDELKPILKWKKAKDPIYQDFPMIHLGNDRWRGQFPLQELTIYKFKLTAESNSKTEAVSTPRDYEVQVVPSLARFSAWYEMFVRSQGKNPGQSGTFKDAEERLADIKNMGFDVLYLAPIHPIGITARKGKNESLYAQPEEPGCPWAVGSNDGGHTAVDPTLGTLEDFKHFNQKAEEMGFRVALDFAIQCSPDHPWVKEHPEWFYRRPDGTIKCAENPPMVYHDIFPLNFETEMWMHLWDALKDVVLFWINAGVKIFRVDNPHTKPLPFWKWLTEQIYAEHPDVIFLAEAFTRPKMMKALSKAGFTQSYTYFMWRHAKWEFTEYLKELATSDMARYFFPNFFTTTHDVLPSIFQRGGESAFKMRLLLAATMSPAYGILNGYELCENQAKPGTEEYLDSDKFEFKVRNWDQPGNIKDFIKQINAIRRENRALQTISNIEFHRTDNDNLLCYSKTTQDKSNILIFVVNLDPLSTQKGTASLFLDRFDLLSTARFQVTDLLTGTTHEWGEYNFVEINPHQAVAHIMRINK